MLEPLAGKRIVVIDDDALVLQGMGGLLRSWGCVVAAAASSDTALGAVDRDCRPDLIISDYHLGQGETGIAVIEQLRHRFRAPIPAFLVSGDVSPERRDEATARGYHLLQKPVPAMTLRALLRQLLMQ